MERRLFYVKKLLETLPQFVDNKRKYLAANMLSLKIELKHMGNKTQLYRTDLTFYPETCKTRFTSISQEEYRNTTEVKKLVTEAKKTAQIYNNTFREAIIRKKR